MDFILELIHGIPPSVVWVGYALLGLTGLAALWQLVLGLMLAGQFRPSANRLDRLNEKDLKAYSWYLRAAAIAQKQMATGVEVSAGACMEPVERAAAAPTVGLRALIGLFVLLGLLGTVWGLSSSVRNLQPALEQSSNASDPQLVIQSLSDTLKGLGGAFNITLLGLFPTILFSGLYGLYAWRAEARLSRVHGWLSAEAIPALRQKQPSPEAQWSLLLEQSRQEFRTLRDETSSYLGQWKTEMGNISALMASSANFLNGLGASIEKLGETADRLNTASDSVRQLVEQTGDIHQIGAHLSGLAGAVQETAAQLTASTAAFQSTLTQLNQSIGGMAEENRQAHGRFLERNNDLIASLTTQFTGWKTQQEQIAADLNKVLTTLHQASSDYIGALTQTKAVLLDTAGLQQMIEASRSSLERWQQQLESLNRLYQQAQRLAAQDGR
ncbi:MAG TPA: MotA/TolQ/ExbB proton channel family protein [Chthonomonadaceae bacterium]|nr:MotA/TolQ/ExbB proton channel family protein [Chthonomonadaceae bacterium]